METLKKNRIFIFSHNETEIVGTDSAGLPISAKPGHQVFSYEEVIEKISALNFYNPSLQIYFRGQTKDYSNFDKNGKPVRSNLYPSLLRWLPIMRSSRKDVVKKRVRILELAEELLKTKLKIGYLHKHQLARWAILQHYEVCQTPLLDVTSSLQNALSFSVKNGSDEGYLYAFGLPHQTGPITVSWESMTQLIDLTKLCPPEASRPHFQSGLLIADYPTAIHMEELIQSVPRVSGNFACRLLTKFHLKNVKSWVGKHFTPTPKDILFPNSKDKWFPAINEIKMELKAQQGNLADS